MFLVNNIIMSRYIDDLRTCIIEYSNMLAQHLSYLANLAAHRTWENKLNIHQVIKIY